MGIGVSFSGHKGTRQFNLDGVPAEGSEAAHLLGDTSRRVSEALNRRGPDVNKFFGGGGDDHTVKLTDADTNPGPLDRKTMRDGAVVAGDKGLCLKGEESGGTIQGQKAYGIVNGKRGYYDLSELDDDGIPGRIGSVGGALAADEVSAEDGQAAVWQTVSHMEIEHDDILKTDILVEYERDIAKTPQGRVAKVSAERRRVLGTISGGGEGGGGGVEITKPWTFIPGTGWTNPAVQIGYQVFTNPSRFTGLGSTSDGSYYLSVDVLQNTLTVTTSPSSQLPSVYIGQVANGEQTDGIYTMPIIFAYV